MTLRQSVALRKQSGQFDHGVDAVGVLSGRLEVGQSVGQLCLDDGFVEATDDHVSSKNGQFIFFGDQTWNFVHRDFFHYWMHYCARAGFYRGKEKIDLAVVSTFDDCHHHVCFFVVAETTPGPNLVTARHDVHFDVVDLLIIPWVEVDSFRTVIFSGVDFDTISCFDWAPSQLTVATDCQICVRTVCLSRDDKQTIFEGELNVIECCFQLSVDAREFRGASGKRQTFQYTIYRKFESFPNLISSERELRSADYGGRGSVPSLELLDESQLKVNQWGPVTRLDSQVAHPAGFEEFAISSSESNVQSCCTHFDTPFIVGLKEPDDNTL